MARILTGVQSTGTPHLGNVLGAIKPAVKMANESNNESFLFIADLHSLTQIKNPKELKKTLTLLLQLGWLVVLILKKLFSINKVMSQLLQSWHGFYHVIFLIKD